jgi:hypothetical protein
VIRRVEMVIEPRPRSADVARVLRAGRVVALLRVYEGRHGHTRIEITPLTRGLKTDLIIRHASHDQAQDA